MFKLATQQANKLVKSKVKQMKPKGRKTDQTINLAQ